MYELFFQDGRECKLPGRESNGFKCTDMCMFTTCGNQKVDSDDTLDLFDEWMMNMILGLI